MVNLCDTVSSGQLIGPKRELVLSALYSEPLYLTTLYFIIFTTVIYVFQTERKRIFITSQRPANSVV